MLDYHLDTISGPDSGRSIPVVEGKAMVLGRGQQCDVQINDPRTSRSHCILQIDNGKLTLRDHQRVKRSCCLSSSSAKNPDAAIACRKVTWAISA